MIKNNKEFSRKQFEQLEIFKKNNPDFFVPSKIIKGHQHFSIIPLTFGRFIDISDIRKKLWIDEYLELVQEDKKTNSAYTSFAQYMFILESENKRLKEQLVQREDIINETINKLKDSEEFAMTLVLELNDEQSILLRLLRILQRCSNG